MAASASAATLQLATGGTTVPLHPDEEAADAAVFCVLTRYSSAQGAHHRNGGHQVSLCYVTLIIAYANPAHKWTRPSFSIC